MGGSAPSVPGPSATEQALQAQQTQTLALQQQIIEKQMREQELVAPILYRQAGVQPQYDEKGNLTGFTELSDPLRDQQKQLQSEFYTRTQNALEGKLPVDPGLLQQLSEQEQQVREQLRKQLGPGYETSTPGIEALAKFNLNKSNILEGARRGDLTMAEQLGLAQTASNVGQQGQNFGQIMGVNQSGLATASAFGNVAGGFGQAAGALTNERLAQYQAALAASQNSSRTSAGIGQGIGSLAGMALGTFLMPGVGTALGGMAGNLLGGAASGGLMGGGMFSDERLKKDIRLVGETESGTPIYTYKYKGTDGPTHMGVMAQDILYTQPEAVAKFGDIFMVDYSKVQ